MIDVVAVRPQHASLSGQNPVRHAGIQADAVLRVEKYSQSSAEPGERRSHPSSDRASEIVEELSPQTPLPQALPASPARQILATLAAPVSELLAAPPPAEAAAIIRQLQVVLRPDHLGAITVVLRLEGRRLVVTIGAERTETSELLRKDLTLLDGILQSVAQEAASVTVVIREANLTGNGPQPGIWSNESSSHTGTTAQGGEDKSPPDKPPGASVWRLEDAPDEAIAPPDSVRCGILVV